MRLLYLLLFFPLFSFAEIKISILGDSNSDNQGSDDWGWVNHLDRELKLEDYNVTFFNHAVGGTTSDYGLEIIDNVLDNDHPHIMIICYGLNDLRVHPPIICILEKLGVLIKKSLDVGAKVLIGQIDLFRFYYQPDEEYLKLFHFMLAEYCLEHQIPTFDFINDRNINGDENTGDSIHPSDSGHQSICKRVKDKLIELQWMRQDPVVKTKKEGLYLDDESEKIESENL